MTEPDMTTPVTRGELRDALELWGGALREQMFAIERRLIAAMEAIGRLDRRIDGLEKRIDQRFVAIDDRMVGMETRLFAELARHSKANAEDTATRIAVLDDKYKDLPARVSRLEAAPPAPRRTRRSRPA